MDGGGEFDIGKSNAGQAIGFFFLQFCVQKVGLWGTIWIDYLFIIHS